MAAIDDIQAQYIAELRQVRPRLDQWWIGLLRAPDGLMAWKRWPTGPSGHPLVLAIFRKHFLAIDRLNRQAEEGFTRPPEPSSADLWGKDDFGEAVEAFSQADWLILDVPAIAPDIAYLVQGICLVPIGMDEGEEYG